MSALSPKLRSLEDGGIGYWCQGCKDFHVIYVGEGAGPRWTWDGNVTAPTFSPSVLATCAAQRCHTFIRGGMVEFLGDCTHALAGQTLPLPDWPYAEGEFSGA